MRAPQRTEIVGVVIGVTILVALVDMAVRADVLGLGLSVLLDSEAMILTGVAVACLAAFTLMLGCSAPDQGEVVAAAGSLEAPLVVNEAKSAASGVASRLATQAERAKKAGVVGAAQECIPGEVPDMGIKSSAGKVGTAAASTAASAREATAKGVSYMSGLMGTSKK